MVRLNNRMSFLMPHELLNNERRSIVIHRPSPPSSPPSPLSLPPSPLPLLPSIEISPLPEFLPHQQIVPPQKSIENVLKNSENSEVCSVCLDELLEEEEIVKTPCSHSFHVASSNLSSLKNGSRKVLGLGL
ncbi:hypothetical protein F8388_016280 [Cannabis sativa]|uniref:RING-type domain-containing protein n=1 Tax=Cannabis sativa TaxID=3483 RepID=A0A7J6DXN3_CANSA|nr:hypothetical protein F8388_016280 [Cannabis sativa]KAF4381858.1 hypothetical protein G4B88_001153 [Cannabis sativa]